MRKTEESIPILHADFDKPISLYKDGNGPFARVAKLSADDWNETPFCHARSAYLMADKCIYSYHPPTEGQWQVFCRLADEDRPAMFSMASREGDVVTVLVYVDTEADRCEMANGTV